MPFCDSLPPELRPKIISFRYSKQYGGKYWANTYVNCGVTRGDNYLFLFEGAVLGHLPLSDSFHEQQSAAAVSAFKRIINRNSGFD